MKIEQQKQEFAELTLTLKTEEAAFLFWDLIEQGRKSTQSDKVREMGIDISNWLSNCGKL